MKLELEAGRTYYRLTFADRDMTMPGVEPLVYLGDADASESEAPHIFQDTVSYVRFVSRLALSQDHEEISVHLIPHAEIGSSIIDV